MPIANTVPVIADPGFSAVPLAANSFAYDPTGSPWTFSGGSGVSANGSGFTSGNPPAPVGARVALIQGKGSIVQSIPGWAAGTYSISFQAAQRANVASAQDFQVTVDGVVVGTFKPTGTAYQPYSTCTFTVAAGSHAIGFVGLDTVGGDNTAFVAGVAIAIPGLTPPAPPATNVPQSGDAYGMLSAMAPGGVFTAAALAPVLALSVCTGGSATGFILNPKDQLCTGDLAGWKVTIVGAVADFPMPPGGIGKSAIIGSSDFKTNEQTLAAPFPITPPASFIYGLAPPA